MKEFYVDSWSTVKKIKVREVTLSIQHGGGAFHAQWVPADGSLVKDGLVVFEKLESVTEALAAFMTLVDSNLLFDDESIGLLLQRVEMSLTGVSVYVPPAHESPPICW